MLICPTCGHKLVSRSVKTSSSGSINVDFCDTCGGVFFDQGEINRIPKKEAVKLAHEHHQDFQPVGTNHCPKCGASLSRYWGESVPSDVYVLRCPDCSGTWFAPQELEKFKQAQHAKINYHRMWKIPLSSLSSVLIPVAVLVALTGLTFITVQEAEKQQSMRSRASEVITAPSAVRGEDGRSVTIIFATKVPATTQLLLMPEQTDAIIYDVSLAPETTHQLTIRSLTPGMVYRYRIYVVTGEDAFFSDEYSLTL